MSGIVLRYYFLFFGASYSIFIPGKWIPLQILVKSKAIPMCIFDISSPLFILIFIYISTFCARLHTFFYWALSKVHVLSWQLLLERISTTTNLFRRRVITYSDCSVYAPYGMFTVKLLESVLKMHRSNKLYKICIHRNCFNFYSAMSLIFRMCLNEGCTRKLIWFELHKLNKSL